MIASELLAINDDQAYRLFHIEAWPQEFRLRSQTAKNDKEKAKIAVERIDVFIKTNGTDGFCSRRAAFSQSLVPN